MILPLALREMRIAARSSRFYTNRLTGALVCLLISTVFYVLFQWIPMGSQRGSALVFIVGTITFYFAVFNAVNLMNDSLSRERREGTLGLLFLTHLRARDIILGKVVFGISLSMGVIMAMFPILSVSMLIGGVPGVTVLKVSVNTLVGAFLALSVGILGSSCNTEQRRAASVSGFLFVFLLFLAPLGGNLLSQWTGVSLFNDVPRFLSPSVGDAFTDLKTAGKVILPFGAGLSSPGNFWVKMLCLVGFGASCLALAGFFIATGWQEKTSSSWRERWKSRFAQWRFGRELERAHHRRRTLDVNPIYWLMSREIRSKYQSLIMTGLMVAIGLLFFARSRGGGSLVSAAPGFVFMLDQVMKSRFAGSTVISLFKERESRALEVILATSIDVPTLLKGQTQGLLYQSMLSFGVMLLIQFLLVCAFALYQPRFALHAFGVFAGLLVLMAASIWAIRWRGAWFAISAPDQGKAVSKTIFPVVFSPYLVLGVNGALAGYFTPVREFMAAYLWPYSVLMLVLVCLFLINLGNSSRQKLLTELRHLVAESPLVLTAQATRMERAMEKLGSRFAAFRPGK